MGDQLNNYCTELKRAMEMLAQDERTVFLGQTVGFPGSRFTFKTLKDIPLERRIELPIMEEAQMGICTGLALGGYIPVSIYPRFDFVLLAANQLVNHLDKIHELSQGRLNPKVIMRTVVGSTIPFSPGAQHCQDYTEQFRTMLHNVDVVKLSTPEMIVPAYARALASNRSTLLVEEGNLHYG
ncbi:MAG: hypothetical protein Q8Q31_03215 [Nanoarchaeota archaeon]|nr:hypothetical protein [Nanoarchaeota archaeon]